MLHPETLLKSEEEIKTFSVKQKLRECVVHRTAFQEMLKKKKVIQKEVILYRSETQRYIKKGRALDNK